MHVRRIFAGLAFAAPLVVFLAVYVPAAGHGFISDDFVWILHNRVRSGSDVWRILSTDNGFYRPTVALTFAINELAFDLEPKAYGLVNVGLALLCAVAVFELTRAANVPRGAAAFAASLWLLNLHAVNMAVLWISGRTALLATAAAAGCAAALLRRRFVTAAVLLALATTSREDALTLPMVSAAWLYALRPRESRRAVIVWLVTGSVIVAGYLAARSTTNAMTPANAPAYYAFTSSLPTIGRNLLEYADRTMTTTAAALLLLAIVVRPARAFDKELRRIALCGALWLTAFLLPALVLPVRSSLYACLPSVGPCVVAAVLADRWWTATTHTRRRHALLSAIAVSLLLWPVHRARTARWVHMADFSTQAIAALRAGTSQLRNDANILIVDDRSERANISSVFSTMLRDAFLLMSGRYMTFYVEPPIAGADFRSGSLRGCGGCEELTLIVGDGRLRVVEGRSGDQEKSP
jgi:hypothetical protein